jgi:NADH dehydrogenase FAD-containing subunit
MKYSKKRIIILGTGFGSFSFIKNLKNKYYEVIVVSPRNHFLFTPLLPSTTVGTIEFRSIIEPVRLAMKEVKYYQAACLNIDKENKKIKCKSEFDEEEFDLEYDELIIGVGAIVNTYNTPGVKENAYFLKELWDARRIRQKIIECLEKAATPTISLEERKRLLNFIVVGGGPTGVEFAAELHDFVTEDLIKWFPVVSKEVKITLVEATDNILRGFDQALRKYARKLFVRQEINLKLEAFVKEITKDKIKLSDGEEIDYGLVVWSAGIGATQLVKESNLPKSKLDRLITDHFLKIRGEENIYAIGDCADIEGKNIPATAQAAQQEGKYLADQFNKKIVGRAIKPFKYEHMGMLAYVGSRRALADLGDKQYSGLGTWVLWRSAYLTKLVSTKNKILVLFDWLKKVFFGRDISRF